MHEPVLTVGAQDQSAFINAFVEVQNVKALYTEYIEAGATFYQKLKKEPWGGDAFIIRDPDGNAICFAEPAANPKRQAR